MAHYKLKALVISGQNNKIFRKEENKVLSDAHFPNGRARELVAKGFLIEVNKDGSSLEEKSVDTTLAAIPEINLSANLSKALESDSEKEEETKEEDGSSLEEKALAYDDISTKELKNWLSERKISFGVIATKKDLYKLYESNFK